MIGMQIIYEVVVSIIQEKYMGKNLGEMGDHSPRPGVNRPIARWLVAICYLRTNTYVAYRSIDIAILRILQLMSNNMSTRQMLFC